jgi:hypothetical protein
MAHLVLSTKRIIAVERCYRWDAKRMKKHFLDKNTLFLDSHAHLLNHERAVGGQCFKICFVVNLAWHAVICAIVLYLFALWVKLGEAAELWNEDYHGLAWATLAIFAFAIVFTIFTFVRMNDRGRFQGSTPVDN